MKLGLGLIDADAAQIVHSAREHGATGILIGDWHFRETKADQLSGMLAENNLEICQFGAFGFNPLLPTKEKEKQTYKQIELAAFLGAKTIVFSGGTYNPNKNYCAHPDNYTDKAIIEAAKTLRPLVQKATSANIIACLEIHFATVLTDWAACKRMVEAIDAPVKLNLDAANMIRFEHYWNTTAFLRQGLETIGEHIATIHAKDIILHDELHLHMDECPAGDGCLDYAELTRLIDHYLDPQVYMIVEHTPIEKLSSAFNHIREAATTSGVTILQ